MHGRSRVSVKAEHDSDADPRQKAALQTKVSLYLRLQNDVLLAHREKQSTTEALQKCAKLLELNPDMYTAWNFRKTAVTQLLVEAGADDAARKKIAEEELRLAERALRKNPKSYGAWQHRKWVVGQGLASRQREFDLLGALLGLDNRNFHGWDYRRYVVAYWGLTPQQELQYSMDKINEDPRNYSAWHSRSQLLTAARRTSPEPGDSAGLESGLDPARVKEEYELVQQALWTAPDDQSGFMYYQWLLSQTVRQVAPSLVATWPAAGSTLTWREPGPLPLVLSFNVPVRGVGEETVSTRLENEDEIGTGADDKDERGAGVGDKDKTGTAAGNEEGTGTGAGDNDEIGTGLEYKDEIGSGAGAGAGQGVSSKGRVSGPGETNSSLADATWRPIGGSGGASATWVKQVDADKAPGGIILQVGTRPGIVSLAGVPFAGSFKVRFDVSGQSTPVDSSDRSLIDLDHLDWLSRGNDLEGGGWRKGQLDKDLSRLGGGAAPLEADEEATAGTSGAAEAACGDTWRQGVLEDEIAMCRELLAEETESTKWPRLTLARLLASQQASGGPSSETEIVPLYRQLAQEDPFHLEYYNDKLGELALDQATTNHATMASHWWVRSAPPQDQSEPSDSAETGWLRLSHVALGRLQGMHRLLWVRQLDLSHNRLRSVHGIECLQLLASLDVSYNRIAASTALAPLVLLPGLRALNVSNNQMGALANDTLRFSSPMPPSLRSIGLCSENATVREPNELEDEGLVDQGGKKLRDCLGSFHGMNLVSLNVAGNEVAKFTQHRAYLKHLMPSLKILDGVPLE